MTAPPADAAADQAAAGAAEAAGPLDLLLSDAALGVLRLLRPDMSALRLAAKLARRPRLAGGAMALLTLEFGRIAAGQAAIAPDRRDRRFADPAWTTNPVLKRVLQAYLAAGWTAERLLATAELDWRDNERMKFLLTNLVAAAAPSNNPLTSPAAWKAAVEHRRPVRRPRRPRPGPRPGRAAARPDDGRARGVRGRQGPGRDAGRRGAPDRDF